MKVQTPCHVTASDLRRYSPSRRVALDCDGRRNSKTTMKLEPLLAKNLSGHATEIVAAASVLCECKGVNGQLSN